jgi:hypothetical protein
MVQNIYLDQTNNGFTVKGMVHMFRLVDLENLNPGTSQ